MKLNIFRRIVLLISLASFMSLVACSSHERSTTQSSETVSIDSNTGDQERTVTRTTSSDEVEEDDGCDGVLSCTVGFVGDVIALPFRAVGALVDFVF